MIREYEEYGVNRWMVVISVCFFFFFKQKTAYEMCGRDWSSDVCSSDLTRPRHGFLVGGALRVGLFEVCYPVLSGGYPVSLEIGRASCRERV